MSDSLFDGWFLAGSAAALSLLAAGWGHVRSFCQQVAGVAVVSVVVRGYQAEAMLLYLKNRFAASAYGPRAYLGWMLYVRPAGRVQLVPMEVTPPAGRLYWRGWRPVWVKKTRSSDGDLDQGVTSRNYEYESLTLLFLRGTFEPDRLLVEATDWFNCQQVAHDETGGRRHGIRYVHGTAGKTLMQAPHHRARQNCPSTSADIRACLPYRPLTHPFSQLGAHGEPGDPFARLALSPALEALVTEARRWKGSEDWYRDRGLPWRRGWLLHGEPGTGKTALARAVAEDLDLPVFAYDLASLYNDELKEAWAGMLAETPCMALIEDIDAVFHGRRNVACGNRQGLTFDCLLNCLDGVQQADGLFVVVTTNHHDRIDPALGLPGTDGLASRPGHIDRVAEVARPDAAGRLKIARRVLADHPGLWERVASEGSGDTGAQFQERCACLALRLRYDEDVSEVVAPVPARRTSRRSVALSSAER
jgi:hypothetical protein